MRKFKLAVMFWAVFLVLTVLVAARTSLEDPPPPTPTPTVVCDFATIEPLLVKITSTPEPEPEVTPPAPLWTEEEVVVLAKMVWGEARGVKSVTEQAACVWCALNRCDSFGESVVEVVTAPYQFAGYDKDNPVNDEIKTLCEDVLTRWYAEKDGETDVGRVLPPDYLFFHGDGVRNHFRNEFKGGTTWDWSLESPYES